MEGTVVVIFVEGETDKEFYDKLKDYIYNSRNGSIKCKVEIKDLTGVGNYKLKACRIFEKAIIPKYPGYKYQIALCYDSDVFEYGQKPPVVWSQVTKAIKQLGASKVIQVKAINSIEDWFLYDCEGVKRYLGLSKKADISKYRGQKGLAELFRRSNKIYIKGNKCGGFINSLDMKTIVSHIHSEIYPLIELLK